MIIGILIAAAGKSQRFQSAGGHGNKLNSLLGERTVFEQTLVNSIKSNLPVHVITRPDNLEVINNCLHFNVPYSLLDSHGLGDSIALGVKNTPDWDGWLIHLADMPYISCDLFNQVAQELNKWPLVRTIYDGLPGHPVGISALYREQLINLSGDEGAKSILQHHYTHQLNISDKSVIEDIDYPLLDNK